MGEPAGGEDGEGLQCALVECVLGNVQTKKWTLELGQTYKVGKKDSGADIEIDHDSVSRRHCSLALTMVEEDLMLVVLDQASSNGTFVDKCKLEKGVGLTKKLTEFRFMMFGQCENGYRILTRGAAGERSAKGEDAMRSKRGGPGEPNAPANKRGGPLSAEQKAQIIRLKRLAGDDDKDDTAPRERVKRPERAENSERAAPAANAAGNRAERREAARLAKDGAGADRDRSRSPVRHVPAGAKVMADTDQDEWQQKAEKAKLMEKDRAKRREEQRQREQAALKSSRRPEAGSKKDGDTSKSSWKADPAAYLARKAREGVATKASGATAEVIEWPEDWR